MEGDTGESVIFVFGQHFNPLPPHGGRPGESVKLVHDDRLFQSTPSAWRETVSYYSLCFCVILFQSTPSAWRETNHGVTSARVNAISIHSLRMEGDKYALIEAAKKVAFQSTPSAWRETAKLHRKAFFISPILVQSCKKGCKRLHSAPEKMVFFEKREKNLVRNLQHLSVRL